jgi:hypothetical protein
MAKKTASEVVERNTPPKLSVHPVALTFKFVAHLRQDGKFKQELTADGVIPEINFNHGITIDTIVTNAKKSLEEQLQKQLKT